MTLLLTRAQAKAAETSPRLPTRNFGYLIGMDAHERVVLPKGGGIAAEGTTDLDMLRSYKRADYVRLHITKHHFRQSVRFNLHDFRCLVNWVTDADQNPRVLENMVRLLRNYKGRVINHPAKVLRTTREEIARRMEGIPGLVVPRTVQLTSQKPAVILKTLEKAGITFPAILRAAGTHGGNLIGLFDNAESLAAAATGRHDHVVTSYVDMRNADGLYRKYRVFSIGGNMILRHYLISDQWNIHASARDIFMKSRPEMLADEKRTLEGGLPVHVVEVLWQIVQRMDLDFFGIDFGITDAGEVVLFEANATMNFFPVPEEPEYAYLKSCLEPASHALNAMLYPGYWQALAEGRITFPAKAA